MAFIPDRGQEAKTVDDGLTFTRLGLKLAGLMAVVGVFVFFAGIIGLISSGEEQALLGALSGASALIGGATLGAICEISMTLGKARQNTDGTSGQPTSNTAS